MRKIQGGISIYLCLIFTSVMALVCTTLEGARLATSGSIASSYTTYGLNSVFSEYATPLFDEYGLFYVWKSQEDFQKDVMDYILYNTDLVGVYGENESTTDNIFLTKLNLQNLEVTDITFATDDNGENFANEITTFMKYQSATDLADTLIENFDTVGVMDKISDFVDAFDEVQDKVQEIADIATGLYEKFETVKEIGDNILDKVEDVQNKISDAETKLEEFKNGGIDIEEFQSILGEIDDGLDDVDNSASEIISQKENIVSDYDNYKQKSSEAEEISTMTNTDSADDIKDNTELVESAVELLQKINLDELKIEDLQEDEDLDYEYYENLINQYESILGSYKSSAEILSGLSVNLGDGESVEEALDSENDSGVSANSIVDFVKDFATNSILSMVVDVSEVSNAAVTDFDSMPSQMELFTTKKNFSSLNDKAMFSLYAGDVFGSYVETKENSVLQYEMEYLIGGKSSDKKNLSKTVEKLLAVREAFNIASILASETKMSEVNTLALSTFGLTGIPALVTLGKVIIVAAWGLGESILDVRELLQGECVKLVKGEDDFNLSLSNLPNIITGTLEAQDETTSNNKEGLNYKQYLEILLLQLKDYKRYYRAMDIIQLNVSTNINEEFKMTECVYAASVKATYTLSQVFVTLPFVSQVVGAADGDYEYEKTASYQY